jgi:hypothetical protein
LELALGAAAAAAPPALRGARLSLGRPAGTSSAILTGGARDVEVLYYAARSVRNAASARAPHPSAHLPELLQAAGSAARSAAWTTMTSLWA